MSCTVCVPPIAEGSAPWRFAPIWIFLPKQKEVGMGNALHIMAPLEYHCDASVLCLCITSFDRSNRDVLSDGVMLVVAVVVVVVVVVVVGLVWSYDLPGLILWSTWFDLMIYLVWSYDLPVFWAGFFLQKEAFFQHNKNMVWSYDLPLPKHGLILWSTSPKKPAEK